MSSCTPCNTCPTGHYRKGCSCHEGTPRLHEGAGSWEGRLQVYTLGKWRSVCSRGFNSHSAALVCQSLGFSSQGFVSKAFTLGESVSAHVRRPLLCDANATQLTSCRGSTDPSFCPRSDWDVGIICCDGCEKKNLLKISGSCGMTGTYERLKLDPARYSNQFYSARTKLFLYKCLAVPVNNNSCYNVATPTMSWVFARQKASSDLQQCPLNAQAFTHIDTADKGDKLYPPAKHLWTVCCDLGPRHMVVDVWREGDVRLVDDAVTTSPSDSKPFQGRFEILHAGEWGSVCNSSFGEIEASRVCASLGYDLGGMPMHRKISRNVKRSRIWMDQVRCKGGEEGIHACQSLGWGNHNCLRGQDAGVVCRTCRPELCVNMNLADCQLHGCKEVSLRNRRLKGVIPGNFHWRYLVSLDLKNNLLEGTLPDTFRTWRSLQYLDVGKNHLSGTLSSGWGDLSSLRSFVIPHNAINSTIPHSIGKLQHLKILNAFDNRLHGTLPAALASLHNLERLYISDNLLTGTVPSVYNQLIRLDSGSITNNLLTGEIPTHLAFTGMCTLLLVPVCLFGAMCGCACCWG